MSLLALLIASAALAGAAGADRGLTRAPSGPCGKKAASTYTHVVVIVMENKAYSRIIGSSEAPYENALARACGLATRYYALTHPSLPNYIAMTAGTTAGITDDAPPADHTLTNPSIFSQVGLSWRAYQESMPQNCELASSGLYAVKHNPAAYFTNVRTACASQDAPLPPSPSFSAAYTFVTPNLCNDTHDCSIATGDAWLKAFVPKILGSREYRKGRLVLFITWDEGNRSSANNVPLLVVGPTVPTGLRVAKTYTHYGLLKTSEQLLRKPCLAEACTAASLRIAFHL